MGWVAAISLDVARKTELDIPSVSARERKCCVAGC